MATPKAYRNPLNNPLFSKVQTSSSPSLPSDSGQTLTVSVIVRDSNNVAMEGVTVIQTFDREDTNPPYQKFRSEYMERYQREPGFPGVYAWDATQVILTALDLLDSAKSATMAHL